MADVDALCAGAALSRQDPRPGTALHVRRFLLVEHPGPWPFHALEAEGLDPDVVSALVTVTRRVGARTLLIRRPGRRPSRDARRWGVVDVVGGRSRWGEWREATDLLAARELLESSSDGWSGEPLVLVCAHGRHDTCCAVRGRPVAAGLAESTSVPVWECTHVGGDRFAANVMMLPDGALYGGLDATSAADVVHRHLSGVVTPAYLRGSSTLAPAAQAVEVAAHRAWGPAPGSAVDSARVTVVERGHRWAVSLRCRSPLPELVEAQVVARRREPAVLTCRALAPAASVEYVVEDLRAAEPADDA